jgi:hypothetical protein
MTFISLQLCQEDDVRLFTYLLPDIYTQFPNIAIGNTDLLYLIVSSIDGTQVRRLDLSYTGLQIEGVLAYFTHLKCQKHIGDDVGDLK